MVSVQDDVHNERPEQEQREAAHRRESHKHRSWVAVTHQVELMPLEVLPGDALDAMKGLGARVREVVNNLGACLAQCELYRPESKHGITGRRKGKDRAAPPY